jgi:para-nitrobenzyl esterase
MRRLFPLALPFALAACTATGGGGPVLPGWVNAPPPPLATSDDALLMGPIWSWQGTQMSDDARFVPDAPERYTVEFLPAGRVSIRADCNRGNASYERNGNALGFGPIALTRMMCPPGSRDAEFLKGLGNVSGLLFRGNDLVLTLKVDSGSMRFTPSRP